MLYRLIKIILPFVVILTFFSINSISAQAQLIDDGAGVISSTPTEPVSTYIVPARQRSSGRLDGPRNPKCWELAACEQYFNELSVSRGVNTVFDEKVHFSFRYTGLNPECPVDQGYCYSPGIVSNLSIPIMGVSQVAGLGGYIPVLFNYLLLITSIASVITISVAGLVWMTARGNTSKVDTAKKMMVKSLLSLIILLFSYTFLTFIDPNLVNLNPLRIPMINQVDYTTGP